MSSFEPARSDRLEVVTEQGGALTDFDYRVAQSMLRLATSQRLPKEVLSYLIEYQAMNGLTIPISQVIGFDQFLAQRSSVVAAAETTTSGTFTALATAGPTITATPDGVYLVIVRANSKISAAPNVALMSVKVNSTEAVDADGFQTEMTTNSTFVGISVQTMSNGDANTLEARYRSTGGVTATFSNRQMYALKIANL